MAAFDNLGTQDHQITDSPVKQEHAILNPRSLETQNWVNQLAHEKHKPILPARNPFTTNDENGFLRNKSPSLVAVQSINAVGKAQSASDGAANFLGRKVQRPAVTRPVASTASQSPSKSMTGARGTKGTWYGPFARGVHGLYHDVDEETLAPNYRAARPYY